MNKNEEKKKRNISKYTKRNSPMQMYESAVKKQLRGGAQGLLEQGVGVTEAVRSSAQKKVYQPFCLQS